MLDRGTTICAHVRRFYCIKRPDDPIFFWDFEANDLIPATAEFRQKVSETGDPCHYNILNLSNQQAKDIAKNIPITSVLFCENGTTRVATPLDFIGEFTDLNKLIP